MIEVGYSFAEAWGIPLLGGSWLNLTEAVQRTLVCHALAGQHPESGQQVREWLGAEVQGWNRGPSCLARNASLP